MGSADRCLQFSRCFLGTVFKDVQPSFVPSINFRHLTTTETRQNTNAVTGGFPSKYNPKDVETGRYDWWMKHNCFSLVETPRVPFSILLPPPNVTGTLHLGHVLTTTVQDVFARWHRMSGRPVVWIPGMDHAGIATQVVVEKILWQNLKKSRHDIGRQRFCEEVALWKDEKKLKIKHQLKKIGASLDWSREFFTLDAKQSSAVVEAFIQLYNNGLIYRNEALVNWSCSLQTAISDIEVDHQLIEGRTKVIVPNCEEPVEFGVLHNFAYQICGTDEEIVVSTTRIETMLGDVAVAVHPEDPRYHHVIGKEVWHPFREEKIPVISDDFVDPEFGTGAVKITPAHDRTDYEVSRRHDLPVLKIISEDGKLNKNCGKFAGIGRFNVRRMLVTELEKRNLLRCSSDHKMQVPFCSRSGDVVEFILKPQWYINCQEMAERAVLAVREGRLKIEPQSFERVWFTYLENIRDWCISRQLWWGHQIPLYKCQTMDNNSTWIAARNIEEAWKEAAVILRCGLKDVSVIQEEDVLDTWFSSALLPFSALGWPHQNEDMKTCYPLSMMVTGNDILFFWVARMVMLGERLTGQLPFKKIFLHGVICDAHGRKMSKSLGNVINPEHVSDGISLKDLQEEAHENFRAGLLSENELQKTLEGHKKLFPAGIPECGTDALRFSLLSQNIQNMSLNFDIATCHTNRLLCNKIWQACRYVRTFHESVWDSAKDDTLSSLSICDKWILSRLSVMIKAVNDAFKNQQLHLATSSLRSFIYTDFCDTYLETTKPLLKSPNSTSAQAACWTLMHCIETFLQTLCPFMPFLTEALHCHMQTGTQGQPLMLAPYPQVDQWMQWYNENIEREFNKAISCVSAVRRIVSLCDIRGQRPKLYIETSSNKEQVTYEKLKDVVATLGDCASVTVGIAVPLKLHETYLKESLSPESSIFVILEKTQITEKMWLHINKKQKKLASELQKMQAVVSADGYKSKAALVVQEQHAEKIKDLESKLTTLQQIHRTLGKVTSEWHDVQK
ncbi:valine--tRNA ligase-like isoform X1 [Schistocerca nitens]|uniref:valine--tRNA ligase-like isoform X1 n=2 Tax=Schistocerca nitens TaxID=7011 RepID=UPI00211901F7|nr:valine--tRNA ligase-like isoform X1 [Schistocerca nitens]